MKIIFSLTYGLLLSWSLLTFHCTTQSPKPSGQQEKSTMTLAQLRESLPLSWNSQRVPESDGLIRIQMLNDKQGWLVGRDGTLLALDKGRTWRTITKVPLPENAYVTDLFFLDSSVGWISASRTKLLFNEQAGSGRYDIGTWLLKTSDGGHTWRSISFNEGVQILQVRFVASNEGWAIGRKLAIQPGQTDANFILHTTDQGNKWENLSDKLPSDSGLLRIAWPSSKTLSVITVNGVVLSTEDAGLTWRNVAAYNNEERGIAIHQFDLDLKNRLCLLAGRGGIEGTISVVSCLERDNEWKTYSLPNVFLNDAVFLEDGTLLACGFSVRANDPIGSGGEALLLKSLDQGRNWEILYRNRSVRSRNALAATDQAHIWVASADGLMLSLNTWPR